MGPSCSSGTEEELIGMIDPKQSLSKERNPNGIQESVRDKVGSSRQYSAIVGPRKMNSETKLANLLITRSLLPVIMAALFNRLEGKS